jgi:hypothetical protein
VLGDIEVSGKLHDPVGKRACRGAVVRLAFPNGLCLRTKTNNQGNFRLLVESFGSSGKRKPKASINIGSRPYRTTREGFVLGFKLDAPTRPLPRKLSGKK